MAKIAATRPAASAPDIGAHLAARAWPLARAAAVPAAILLVALVLRVARLELQAWTPDTYEQMTAAHRLVSGQLPLSPIYPPGVAVTLAPAFLFFPHTLETVQGVIIASSLGLIAVVYVAMRRATDDRLVPALLALGVATAPQFVYFSRDGLFDVVNTMWIVAAILAVPWVRRQPTTVLVAYGAMVAVAISIRATNPAFLPALFLYWIDIGTLGFKPRAIWNASFRREPIIAVASMAAAFFVLAYISGAFGHAANDTPLTFETFRSHIAYYAASEFGGWLAAPLVLALAVLGTTYLWNRNRTLLFVCIYMLTIFPLVHVPLPFRNSRYMLPSLVFAMILAAHAPAALAALTERQAAAVRHGWRVILACAFLLVGVYFAAADTVMLRNWPDSAAKTDEAAYRQLRPTVAELPAGSLLVSGGARGVRASNDSIEYIDLIDYALNAENSPARVNAVMDRIASALADGRPVYYLYTRIEGLNLTLGAPGPSYQPYFDATTHRFHTTELHPTTVKWFTLYKVEAPQ